MSKNDRTLPKLANTDSAELTKSADEKTSRRGFLKKTAQGTAVMVVIQAAHSWHSGAPFLPAADAQVAGKVPPLTPQGSLQGWIDGDGKVLHRFDGMAKVTGAKVYGRDFRSVDLPGWPTDEGFAHVIRSNHCAQVFAGFKSPDLLRDLGATALRSAADFDAWHLKAPAPFWIANPFVKVNSTPKYYGQPLGILFFEDKKAYLKGKGKLAELPDYIQWSAAKTDTRGDPQDPFGVSRFVRYRDLDGKELISYLEQGPWSPPWKKPNPVGDGNEKASFYLEKIRKDLENPDWKVFRGNFVTQSVDPMFMEPESGLAWYNPKTETLSLTYGTQSPQDDIDSILSFIGPGAPPVTRIEIRVCLPGGGFGGRDSSEFPMLLALSAVSRPGAVQRMIYSRSDQFQAGLKRHAGSCQIELGVSVKPPAPSAAKTGDKKKAPTEVHFEALEMWLALDGGGQNNYSFAVQNVGARNGTGAYDFSRSSIESEARPSTSVPAGSMRGFGSLQSTFALEVLVDQIASELAMDPIELRRQNLLKDGKPMHTGVMPSGSLATSAHEILDRIQKTDLWQNRIRDRKERSTGDRLYGVGMALALKSFGKSPGDTALASISLDPSGKLTLATNSVDMGNGTSTTLPLALFSQVGRSCDHLHMGATEVFAPLRLSSAKAKDQKDQDALAQNPWWVPSRSMSAAASAGAYQMRHAVLEAARIFSSFGIWPAACGLWNLDLASHPPPVKGLVWKKGMLTYQNRTPLSWDKLTLQMHRMNLITGVMVHSFYRSQWAEARFEIGDSSLQTAIDGLALKTGDQEFKAVSRKWVNFPPFKTVHGGANRYTPYGIVVAVEVSRQTGEVSVVDARGFLECGTVIQEEIVLGQMEGAFAMGIGQTLLEDFPLNEGGPGQGGWNLSRYQVPLARHCALAKSKFYILNPGKDLEPKGMAEVVLNAVPPAIANATLHATGVKIYQLPIRPSELKAQLGMTRAPA